MYRSRWIDISFNFSYLHIRLMGESRFKAVVFKDEWLEHILEVYVGILVTSIDSTMLIIKFNCAGYCLKIFDNGNKF